MLKGIKIGLGLTFVFILAFVYKRSLFPDHVISSEPSPEPFLKQEDELSIIFVETTEQMMIPPLASCSVESAARTYPNRSIHFFIKGLKNNTLQDLNSISAAFALLSGMKNVFLLPFPMETVFQETPLLPWYHKVNPAQEMYWLHVSSDASRLALVWKYGGIYMDTDVISIRPISLKNFLTAEAPEVSGSAIFGFSRHHWFIWDCMEDFVANYKGDVWGYQGPTLLTRMFKALCSVTEFHIEKDISCKNISFLEPERFYPIPYAEWKKYFRVWERNPSFNNSYSLHLWNFMNKGHESVVAGSNTLVENLFKTHCPTTYKVLIQGLEDSGP